METRFVFSKLGIESMEYVMSTFQGALALAAPGVNQGSALTGIVVVSLVVCAVMGTFVWVFFRIRKVGTVFKKSGSGVRERRFAAEVLREFGPDSVGVLSGVQVRGRAISPGAELSVTDVKGPAGSGGLVAEVAPLEDFYARSVTSKPVRSAVPATGSLVTVGAHPELTGVFGESLREFVEGIRSLAVSVEQAAVEGGGSELDRAVRSVEAFTTGLGALPLKEILVSADQAITDERRRLRAEQNKPPPLT